MAHMIPEKPREFIKSSREDIMFDSLTNLDENYYVFHSFRIITVENDVISESETDFVVFNPELGILVIEAKAGHPYLDKGVWRYQSGKEMSHDGPYNQADQGKWRFYDIMKDSSLVYILSRCKLAHAVWFPDVKKKEIDKVKLPSEAEVKITLLHEDLENPEQKIKEIFGYKSTSKKIADKTDLSESDTIRLLRDLLCPEFNIFPTGNMETDLKNIAFNRMLNEQKGLLNYLVEQRTAVINGAAGTGKTMIATEKARRHAVDDGDKVLFLCYNSQLRDFLEKKYGYDGVDYYTIAGYACKMCNTNTPDYDKLTDKLLEMLIGHSFPYDHVIVDEGQDFGIDQIEEADILNSIYEIIRDDPEEKKTFYVFYDKLQLNQAKDVPKFLEEADCKLTLYRNCRNTRNIAETSLKPITERTPKLLEDAVKGLPVKMFFCGDKKDIISKIDDLLDEYKEKKIEDVVILTCKTENNSVLTNLALDGKYKKKKFSTCRKFKGLEAEAVILVDIDANTFDEKQIMNYYVGTSRAKQYLTLFTTMNNDDCQSVLFSLFKAEKPSKVPQKDLAQKLNVFPSKV